MYYRIKHRFEAELLSDEIQRIGIDKSIADRILYQIGIIDDNYNNQAKIGGRCRNDYGGYVLFFPDELSYRNAENKILTFYNINPDLYEYEDCILDASENQTKWMEKLFLLGSDEGLLLIYPQKYT